LWVLDIWVELQSLSSAIGPECPAIHFSRPDSHCQLQLNGVVRRMREILFRPEVAFSGLHRRMAKQQLNPLQLPARSPAQFRRRAPTMPNAA
jgi:hypothetical protein